MTIKKKDPVFVLRGKVSFFKFQGQPRDNYGKDGFEWTTDFYDLDKDDIAVLKKAGLAERIKDRDEYLDGNPFLTFKQKYRNVDPDTRVRLGPDDHLDPDLARRQRQKYIAIVDKNGNPWDENVLIGNGSVVDVKFKVVDYGKGKKSGVYVLGFRVLELVPYAPKVFDDLDEEDAYYGGDEEGSQNPPFDDDSVEDIGYEDEEEVV